MNQLSGHTFPHIDITKTPDYLGYPGIKCPKCGAYENCLEISCRPGIRELSCGICGYMTFQIRLEKAPKNFRMPSSSDAGHKKEPAPPRMCIRCGTARAKKRSKYCGECAVISWRESQDRYDAKIEAAQTELIDTLADLVILDQEGS